VHPPKNTSQRPKVAILSADFKNWFRIIVSMTVSLFSGVTILQ